MLDVANPTTRTAVADPRTAALRRAGTPVSSAPAAPARSQDEAGLVLDMPSSAKALPASREPGLQRQLGRMQQGLDYLDRLGASLQGLKSTLSQGLAQGQASARLPQQVSQLRDLWQRRDELAGGQVDGQLQVTAGDEAARQRFKLRGLDRAALDRDGTETLRLQLPAKATPQGNALTLAIPLGTGDSQQRLQALAGALAPAGVRVEAQGADLELSVDEARWPALRDGLALSGDGKRFPSSQPPVRARLDAAPDALQPQQWDVGDAIGQRQALGQVLQAQTRLGVAREQVSQKLENVQQQVPAATGLSAASAKALADNLQARLDRSDYASQRELLPALRGLHKQRVRQLLQP